MQGDNLGSSGEDRPTYLFVIDSFGAGGAERSLVELVPAVAARGRRPVVVCLHSRDVGFEDDVRASGVDLRFLSASGLVGKVRELRRLIEEERPALVYSSLFEASLVTRLAAARKGVPVMVNLANTSYDPVRRLDPNIKWWRFRLVQEVDGYLSRHLTDHFHAVSQAVKDSAVASLRIPPDQITVVYRGRDPERIGEPTPERRQRVRRALGLDDETPVLVTVGRQEFQKGHRYLIEAMPKILERHPRTRLLIVGRRGAATPELERAVADFGVADSVSFLGHRADVTDLMAASDLFVFPSLFEGLGGALIEALALGLPIVASDIPPVREVVGDDPVADLVPPRDAAALAETVAALLDEPDRRRRYAEAGRDRFRRMFLAEHATARLVDLLDEVAGLGPERSAQPRGR
ncbi:MAG: glycosyltransferase [Actinomycetes bacterium]